MLNDSLVVWIVFSLTIVVTFIAAIIGRKHDNLRRAQNLKHHNLNKWMIGLSAGATANSGFIVTGAVGLGYVGGLQWILLPLSWFLGDIIFWKIFPQRINHIGRSKKVTTISELLSHDFSPKSKKIISILATLLILLCLGGYTSAQWLAGQKFFSGVFNLPNYWALIFFTLLITAYTAIGGFRGSVYADSIQAIIRVLGTLIALIAVIHVAYQSDSFLQNIQNTDTSFLMFNPDKSLVALIGFILGFSAAALGFGLGQPQLLSRYLAGESPKETQAAWWIYIGFVQFTWIAMTLFGVILKGILTDLDDPEMGLSIFFVTHLSPILTGIIVADIFATISATSNSLLVAMTQAVLHDFSCRKTHDISQKTFMLISASLGICTMIVATLISKTHTIFDIAITSVSLMGAGLAAPVMIKVMQWKTTEFSLIMSLIFGFLSSVLWKYTGYGDYLNEAAIGISIGLITNILFRKKMFHFLNT